MAWSYYAGRKAGGERPSSRVRVYERLDIPGRIYLSRAWIRTPSGAPEARPLPLGITREAAQVVADEAALERRRAILGGEGQDAFGNPKAISLRGLLDQYHDSTAARRWSKGHQANQEHTRDFWLMTLGEDVPVAELTAAIVENTAARARRRNGWSARTEERYLKYLKAATRWGWRKARLYEVDPLLAVDTPEVSSDTTDRIYELAELRILLAPHPKVDWRVTLAANIAADTGRRIGAIRQLKTEDLELGDDRLVLHFRPEVEKTKRGAHVPVSEPTAQLVADALDREDVQKAGYLFPGGDKYRKKFWGQPLESASFVVLLRKAETKLEIEHVPHRGWHGIKRAHVTAGFEVSGGDAALVGDVTGNVSSELLRNVYRQQDRGRITAQVDAVRARIEGHGHGQPDG